MAADLNRKTGFYACIAILGILLDQGCKYAAVTRLKDKGDITLIRGVLSLTYTENKGAAFGMLPGGRFLFAAFALVVTVGAFVYIRRILKNGGASTVCLWLALIGAGAAGNLIDRIARGYVVDFIYFSIIDFPVFNIADIFVVCSCFMLVITLLTDKEETKMGGVG